MAYPSLDQYGAIQPAFDRKNLPSRLATIGTLVSTLMVVAIVLSPRPGTEKVAKLESQNSPEQKLNRLIQEFIVHKASMSLEEMEEKIDHWSHDPETLLNLPHNAHSEVHDTIIVSVLSNFDLFLLKPDSQFNVQEKSSGIWSLDDFSS